jgi:hypothetical protein
VSYLYALDRDGFERLLAQSRFLESPFEIVSASHLLPRGPGWRRHLQDELAQCDLVITIAPSLTGIRSNVTCERESAREAGLPEVVLLTDEELRRSPRDVAWSWNNLRAAILALCS